MAVVLSWPVHNVEISSLEYPLNLTYVGKSVCRMGSVKISEGDDGGHSHSFSLSNLQKGADIYNYGEYMDSYTVTRLTNSVISINP